MGAQPDLDTSLMLRVRDGDMEAFQALVDKYKQPVINLVYRTLHDLNEAEDIAQNVFLQVFRSAPRYHATAKFSTWLFTIARNLTLNEIRRRSRHPAQPLGGSAEESEEHPLPQPVDLKEPSPTAELLHHELEEKIQQVLLELPENQRIAVVLCREEELSYEEISKVLGCSLSATKSLIHRGRETLKLKLKPYLQSGHWKAREK
jgi:RNA polymerase sigma-70 factor, ECF subfamily